VVAGQPLPKVGDEDHQGHDPQRGQQQPGGEPGDDALAGHLGQPDRERQRRDHLGAAFHDPEGDRPEADVVAERLRAQRHGEPQQRNRPGHEGDTRGPQAPRRQQARAHGGDERADGGDQEMNRHC
jgi:hypothetical protein